MSSSVTWSPNLRKVFRFPFLRRELRAAPLPKLDSACAAPEDFWTRFEVAFRPITDSSISLPRGVRL